ncbi:MAG: DEAD/DEAH box helicase [Candidatus Aenigmarchaeota archaeon]|nr:DEAD/DEAH box helicase [Candidatus Aenigmarchaeota archaeon]
MNSSTVVKDVLRVSGFSELNPVQKAALEGGLLEGKNMVLAAATASGKTLVAEMAMLNSVRKGKKALYIVPLKALASEKYSEFREKYSSEGIKVAMSIVDKDSSESWVAGFDIIIVTSEKLDSIIRHGADWLAAVGLVVADEVHLIDSPDRGPTLEVILTRLRQLIDPQILALSATISNHNEIAEWLEAVPVKSDYRPVKLYSGVFHGNEVSWHPEKKKLVLPADLPPVFEIIRDTMKKEKQALVFVYTRKNAELLSEKLGDVIKPTLNAEERSELAKLSYDIVHVMEHPTRQCERLGLCVQKGAVFHHAGLVAKQRKLIEDAFRKGLIKVISATPTLAAGVNLPAYRVVIRDFKRFAGFRGGMDYIPVLEIQQMCGRAGRPQYDKEGEAILIARDESEAKKFWNEYVKGDSEKIVSKLGVEPVLRTHVLSLIAAAESTTKSNIMGFFSRTFYAYQYKDMTAIEREIDSVLDKLVQFGFIERPSQSGSSESFGEFMSASSLLSKDEDDIRPTRIGKRVAELYIDPLSANNIITGLEDIKNQKKLSGMSIMHVLSSCIEMPGLNIRKKDMVNEEGDSLLDFIAQFNQHLVGKIPNEWEIEYDNFLRKTKLVWMMSQWTEESSEDNLMEDFGITPGDLRGRLEISDWLFYSMQELGLLLNMRDVLETVRKTRLRVKYGIKEELLPLVRLRSIGRVRARKLFTNGYVSVEKLRGAPLTSLTNILGPNIAKGLRDQLSGPVNDTPKEYQGSLDDYESEE